MRPVCHGLPLYLRLNPTGTASVATNNHGEFSGAGECNNVAYLPRVLTAVVGTVLINVTSPKHEPQRQQTRRPCDHQPQQKTIDTVPSQRPPWQIFPMY